MVRGPALVVSGACLAGMVTLSLITALQVRTGLPLPLYWGFSDGRARWTGLGEALVLLPAFAVFVTVVLALLDANDRRQYGEHARTRDYRLVWVAASVILLGLHAWALLPALGLDLPIPELALTARSRNA
jgi:hypothetical protein